MVILYLNVHISRENFNGHSRLDRILFNISFVQKIISNVRSKIKFNNPIYDVEGVLVDGNRKLGYIFHALPVSYN